jgi:hypothetical protein
VVKRAPDLQRLVESFGGYDKISAEVWEKYDEAVKQWQANRLAVILNEQYCSPTPPRPRTRRKAGRTG